MRILFTNFHQGPGIGGHSIYILSLATTLSAEHDITIAAPAGSGLLRRAQALPRITALAQDFPNRVGAVIGAVRQLRRILNERHIDVIHVNGSADHRLAMLARVGMGARRPAIVFTKHNDQAISAANARFRGHWGTDHVIAVCEFVRQRVAATAYAKRPISVIANGIDTAHFSRAALTTTPSLAAERERFSTMFRPSADDGWVVFGSQAGTDDYKGWMDLVTAVSRLPLAQRDRVRIALAGALPSARQVQAVEEAGMSKHVFFVGPLDDVRPFIGALDVGFVLSWRVETISFACREMMAMGVPVVVSDHGGLPENIDSGVDGWIVPERDIDAIGALVAVILEDDLQRHAIGAAAAKKAQQSFGLAGFVGATLAVYESTQQRS